jgi:hypothetical protein
LKSVLSRIAGPAVTLVDSAEAVAEVVAQGLAEAGLALAPRAGGEAGAARQHLCVTDAGLSFQAVAGRILGDPDLPLEWVEVV